MSPELLKWIEEQKPALVGAAEGYIEDTAPHRNDVSPSQLRNLLAAAQAGQSVALLRSLLRYQIGRSRNGWRHSASGEALLTLLAERVAAPLATFFPQTQGTPVMYAAEARLAALLLGYVVREFTYQSEKERKPRSDQSRAQNSQPERRDARGPRRG